MKKIAIAVLLSAVCIAGCRKKDEPTTDVTFSSQVSKDVVLTIYPSFEDYTNGTNAVLRQVVPALDKVILKGENFNPGQTYYLDWYTDNFLINNWFNDNFPQQGSKVAIRPVAGANSFYFDPSLTGKSRKVFLSTDDKMSSWYAIDAFLYSSSTGYVSQWGLLSNNEKYRQLVVRKNCIADYTYKSGSGIIKTDALQFKVHNSPDAYIEFMDASGNSLGSVISGRLPSGTGPDYATNSTDTVMALFPDSDVYFMMVHQ